MDERTMILICLGAATAANHVPCFEHYYKKAESLNLTTEEIQEAVDLALGYMGIQKEMEQRQMGECIQDKINFLPEPLRAVIILFDTMDLSHQEIAESLGIAVGNVKVRLHRARKKLKAILEEACTFDVDERNVMVCEPVNQKKSC